MGLAVAEINNVLNNRPLGYGLEGPQPGPHQGPHLGPHRPGPLGPGPHGPGPHGMQVGPSSCRKANSNASQQQLLLAALCQGRTVRVSCKCQWSGDMQIT